MDFFPVKEVFLKKYEYKLFKLYDPLFMDGIQKCPGYTTTTRQKFTFYQ